MHCTLTKRSISRCWACAQANNLKIVQRRHQIHAVTADQLGFWDVVEYSPTSTTDPTSPAEQKRLRLGLVQQVESSVVQLTPLIEEEEGLWVPELHDASTAEQQEQVHLAQVLRIVETAYGQRQDRDHNPHGEHAHDVWQVLEPLSPGVLNSPLSRDVRKHP